MATLNVVSICGSLRKALQCHGAAGAAVAGAGRHDDQTGSLVCRFPALQRRYPEHDRLPRAGQHARRRDSRGGRRDLLHAGIQLHHSRRIEERDRLGFAAAEPAVRRQADCAAIGVAGTGRRRPRAIRHAQGHDVSRCPRSTSRKSSSAIAPPGSTKRPGRSPTRPRAASSSSNLRRLRPTSCGWRRRARRCHRSRGGWGGDRVFWVVRRRLSSPRKRGPFGQRPWIWIPAFAGMTGDVVAWSWARTLQAESVKACFRGDDSWCSRLSAFV